MIKIAIVAEGVGDVAALPSLIAKTAQSYGINIIVVKVVRAGGWPKLRQVGQLERFCKLAASHEGVERVLVVTDLDDDCPKTEVEYVRARVAEISNAIGLPINICFCVREYEAWFLEDIETIKSLSINIPWNENVSFNNPENIRGAKELFEKILGSKYRESIDQDRYTKLINPLILYKKSRSFRKFTKCILNLDYDEIEIL